MKRVLIIGGYGNFGTLIARRLAREKDIHLIVAGRSAEKAQALAIELRADWAVMDVLHDLGGALQAIKPDIVIHTSGPFQGQDYTVASACIRAGCHYIDLADARDFVSGINSLDYAAREGGVVAISGASSVPALTAAIIDHYRPDFSRIDTVDYAITTAQRTNAGLATTAAILGYVGKRFTTRLNGRKQSVFGWQGLVGRRYPELGHRLLGYCDIPDLALFPQRYPELHTIRFRAGLEVPLLHLGLWLLSWLVRARLVPSLQPLAPLFSRLAKYADRLGSDRSAFHMTLTGLDNNRLQKTVTFYLVTAAGHGLHIPCIPAVLLCLRLARGVVDLRGAMPCMGMITRDEYLAALADYQIKWIEES